MITKTWITTCFILLLVTLIGGGGECGIVEEKFANGVKELITHITANDGVSFNSGYEWLEPLVDDFGNRLTCSKRLEAAIEFTVHRLKFADNFDVVRTELVHDLPFWERGDDRVTLLEPRILPLNILSIAGADPANVSAEAIVLRKYDELENVNVTGKIVIFAYEWRSYFDDLPYRKAAARIKELGGVGLLAKSLGPFSIGSPHTGSGTDNHLPAASLTLEEANLLDRLARRNKTLKLNMDMKSKNMGTCTSKNIIFDIRGTEHPEEIVMLSAHIDSWDLGQGALDDGGGMAAVWQAMKALQRLAIEDKRFRPKRTIRAIFWTAEEQGFYGAKAYHAAHKNTNETFIFVSETDQGAFRPTTTESIFRFMGNNTHKARLTEIADLLTANGIPLSVHEAAQQTDVQSWADEGVPSINYVADRGREEYFWYHHTTGDYLSIFKPGDIDYTAAVMATLGHVIANQDSWM